ncbi:MAG: SMP-30/gluconolactonase/LRE family protein [Candidatus Eremiobacteraeota bacterium]|nr:SMP-30/gluconolactonase/LRE family protein [Candidatus Eremiobacteraeota bacterium]MBV8281044.1 SMP-30/gluconolactonase/LRE family protein [Candidatus Eremiobacteraeota bacterium]
MRRRSAALKPPVLIALLAIAALLGTGITLYAQHRLALPQRVEIVPADAAVFPGSSIAFNARLVGGDGKTPVRWSVVGPGHVSASGVYSAPAGGTESAIVVARAGDVSTAARVRVTAPPGDIPLLLIACYDGNGVDVRDLSSLARAGMLSAPDDAAGIAVDPLRRLALVAAKERVMAIDLRTMALATSVPKPGARFDQAVRLAGGYFAATDNNASKGSPGVLFFRIGANGAPEAAGSAIAGETPEGIAVSSDARTFYVTNVNSNELLRFAFDGRGGARLTGRIATGTRPYGIALDESRHLLFVADNDTPTVNGDRSHPGLEVFALPALRRIGASISTGSKDALPIGVAVDEKAGRVFVTNEGDSNVAVFDLPALHRIATLPTGKWPWTPRLDAGAHRLYVPSAHDDVVDVFDTRTLRSLGSVQTCAYPTNVANAPRRSL